MSYYKRIRERVLALPPCPQQTLALQAMRLEISVQELSRVLGAGRKTVYNWFYGGSISPAYQQRVHTLIDILLASDTREETWARIQRVSYLNT